MNNILKEHHSIETEVTEALNQSSFDVKIGNKTYAFNKLSLSDREKISMYSSILPELDKLDEIDDALYKAIDAGRYSKVLARIITIASKPKSNWKIFRNLHINIQKRKIYKALMNEPMEIMELYAIYRKIARQIAPAFFLDIIISLRGSNHLKPTKGTGQTVHGQ